MVVVVGCKGFKYQTPPNNRPKLSYLFESDTFLTTINNDTVAFLSFTMDIIETRRVHTGKEGKLNPPLRVQKRKKVLTYVIH